MERNHKILLQSELHTLTPEEMIRHGIKYLGSFHAIRPLKFGTNNNVIAKHTMLVYYYHNRLSGYQLEDQILWDSELIHQAQELLQEPA
jgi:hypothetical protein